MVSDQSQKSVESFDWQWTKKTVVDSTRTFHRRLYKDCGIWFDYLDGKVVADVCSGNGRHVWAINRLTKPKKIISVELAKSSAKYQEELFKDIENIEVIQGDAGEVQFKADFIYMVGAIQHVSDPDIVLKNIIENLNDKGELVVSFYLKTPATIATIPIRAITKRLPKKVLWWISPILAPIFLRHKAAREMGLKNARHTAYDWFGSHEYQRYFVKSEILKMFKDVGIDDTNIILLQKGLYKVRKGEGAKVDDEVHSFGL
jgi:ubiquinone/menaquinone biosynthesis C-methylase UbiE